MKKFFLFVSAMLVSVAMNAQTIVMDGSNADWANIPMLSEPGVLPMFKMVVPQEGLTLPTDAAFCVMVERTEEQKATYPGYPVVYVDADQNKDTKSATIDPWYCPAFGPEYEMATWDDGNSFGANDAETMHELCFIKSNFDSVPFPFAGSLNAWMLFNWAKYMPNDPSTNEWKWGESNYHPIIVKPYKVANLESKHAAADIYSSHEALTVVDAIDVKGSSSNDLALWASWVVELKQPAIFDITADITSTNTASVDLALVSTATNEVVASFASEDLAEGAEVVVGEWDLSAIPAGIYMLKFTNHVAWSAMKLNSVTLKTQSATSLDQTTVNKANKVIRNGQMVIIRDGKTFNALGAEIQ